MPFELAGRLHEPLRAHFRDTDVEVVVEQRRAERRSAPERRTAAADVDDDRRLVRGVAGRRIGDRRTGGIVIAPPATLPRAARGFADRLVFLERLEPSGLHAEDLDTLRLVTRFQSGDREAFAEIYVRFFDRVYRYLRLVLRDAAEAEDATQQVFMGALVSLPRYEHRGQPYRALLFRIARNEGIDRLRRLGRFEPLDPEDINTALDEPDVDTVELSALDWITDRELLMFIDRLPLAQRQVLMLRFTLGLSTSEVAAILDRAPADVRMLQSRALRFLRDRLEALGRRGTGGGRIRMRRHPREAPVLRARRWALTR